STHIEPLEYRDFLERIWQKFEQYKECGTTFNLKDHLWTLFLYEKGLFRIPDAADANTIYDGCHCGDCHMTILPTGSVMACRRFESPVGNLFHEHIHRIYNGEKMNAYRQYERFEKCSRCELLRFCRGCPAVAYGYTHNFYAADPQCWKVL
ncbi:MAG: SPASM domain-containing protein, partial [Bacteroidaceae bacterium]|nr:SPASM domain-containing protein [Bacteroidaceae bacterium]